MVDFIKLSSKRTVRTKNSVEFVPQTFKHYFRKFSAQIQPAICRNTNDNLYLPIPLMHERNYFHSHFRTACLFAMLDWVFITTSFCILNRPIISCKAMTTILYGNFEKSFLECEKMASRNIFWHFFRANFFMFVLLMSNHMVFVVRFEAARAISAFWKLTRSTCWTRNRMITYTNVWSHTTCH